MRRLGERSRVRGWDLRFLVAGERAPAGEWGRDRERKIERGNVLFCETKQSEETQREREREEG